MPHKDPVHSANGRLNNKVTPTLPVFLFMNTFGEASSYFISNARLAQHFSGNEVAKKFYIRSGKVKHLRIISADIDTAVLNIHNGMNLTGIYCYKISC